MSLERPGEEPGWGGLQTEPGGAGALGGQWAPGGHRWCVQVAWGGYLGPFWSLHLSR